MAELRLNVKRFEVSVDGGEVVGAMEGEVGVGGLGGMHREDGG